MAGKRGARHAKPLPIAELLKRTCRKGHSRRDAYVYVHPYTGKTSINCRTCAQLTYKRDGKRQNAMRRRRWKETRI